MIESPLLIPPYGSMDKPFHVLGMETIQNEAASEPFNPRFNNVDFQGGTGKFTCNTINGNTSFRTYGIYGLSADHIGTASTGWFARNFNAINKLLNLSNDIMVSADFECIGLRDNAETAYETFNLGFYQAFGINCYMSIRWGTAGSLWPGLTISMEIVGVGGAVTPFVTWSYVVPPTHPVYSSFNLGSRIFNASMIWSRNLALGGLLTGHYLFINGYYITSPALVDSRSLNAVGGNWGLYVEVAPSMNIIPISDSVSTVKNLRIRPVLLYGDGSVIFPYSPSWELSSSNGPAFDTNSLYNSPQDFKFTGNPIYVKDDMAIRIKNIGRSGFYPIWVTMPISGNVGLPIFENLSINRAQNNPFIKKPPILMVDHSLDIGDNYIDTGAVYEASGRESYPKLSNDGRFLDSRNQPSAVIGLDHESIWKGMMNGLGDSGKVDSTAKWNLIGVNNYHEDRDGLLSESSYPGVVCQYKTNTDPQDGGSGIISCNRAPTDPMTFYLDGSARIPGMGTKDTDVINPRIIGLNSKGTDRHMALMIGIVPIAVVGVHPVVTFTYTLRIMRILNNDKLDTTAPFGAATGSADLLLGCSGLVMYDLPYRLGIVPPLFKQPPDIAIVPIGNPRTTTSFRVYWLNGVDTATGLYNYEIRYTNITNNGSNWSGGSAAVKINMESYNNKAGSPTYTIPLQFDIIQPEDGKFIMVVTLGMIQAPGSVIPYLEYSCFCVMLSSTDGVNFNNPIPINSGAFNNTVLPGYSLGYYNHFGLPHLSYTPYGKNAGEILLGLTNMRCAESAGPVTEQLSSFVFKTSLEKIALCTSTAVGNSPFTVLVNCRKLINESPTGTLNVWNQQYILGVAAFRDRHNKIHIAMNKKPYSEAVTGDIMGSIYYVVIDDTNYAVPGA